MLDVVAIGETLIDFTVRSAGADGYPVLEAHPGGAPANFLCTLSKFGTETAFLTKAGNDAFGRKLRETLRENGVDVSGFLLDDTCFTTLAFVTLGEDGEREFSFARKPGADLMLHTEELDFGKIDCCSVFHFGTLSLTGEPARTATRTAVEYARKQGKLLSFDPNLRPPLWESLEEAREQILWGLSKADIVKISEEETAFLWGISAEKGAEKIYRDFGSRLVFVTCGAGGCYYRNAKASGYVPAHTELHAIDTTGAGDIFGGAAMWAFLQTGKQPEKLEPEDLQTITEFACAAAGVSVTRNGGIPSIPQKHEVMELLAKADENKDNNYK